MGSKGYIIGNKTKLLGQRLQGAQGWAWDRSVLNRCTQDVHRLSGTQDVQQLNKLCILETVAFVREKRTHQYARFRKKT